MQLHEIKREHPLKKKKRVGRGGKRGTFSGRGTKGQKSRAGRAPRPALRDIVKRFPKKRGYQFTPSKPKAVVLNVKALEQKFNAGEVVNLVALRAKNLIKQNITRVKILGDGDLTKALIFKGMLIFSKSALEKIKKAGGKIETIARKRPTLTRAERKAKKPRKAKKIIAPEAVTEAGKVVKAIKAGKPEAAKAIKDIKAGKAIKQEGKMKKTKKKVAVKKEKNSENKGN